MKAWMKILMWVGLGGGIGFFAGYQVGAGSRRTEEMNNELRDYQNNLDDELEEYKKNLAEAKARTAMDEYTGDNGEEMLKQAVENCRKAGVPEEKILHNKEEIDRFFLGNDNVETVKRIQEEEDPDMPEEVPVIGDEDTIEEIRELHPQDMAPVLITESEWNENPWNYDKETMGYYSLDDKLYNFATRSVIKDNDEVVGIGNLYGFYGTQENPGGKDIIFVRNDCLGTLFKIGFFDSALNDITGGADSPEYEEEEYEDETE